MTGGARPEPLRPLIRPVTPLAEAATMAEAVAAIRAVGHGLPVVGPDGRLAGLVESTQVLAGIAPGYLRDLHAPGVLTHDTTALRRRVAEASGRPVADVMLREPLWVDTDDSEMHAAALFLRSAQTVLPVVDAGDGRVVGVLRLPDLVDDMVAKAHGP